MSTARNRAIAVREQEAEMPEVASVVSEAINNAAEAMTDVAGALCYEAATRYIGTAGEQRQIAAVMFHTARQRFGGVKYDGQPIEEMDIRELDALWQRLTGGRPKR